MDNKIILINKPKEISSHKCIKNIQKEYNLSKIGHAGTLDPMAEGLLIAMSGKATKLSDDLMKKDKIYEVKMQFGYETDTLDLEGTVIKRCDKKIIKDNILKSLDNFKGKILQKPPMYSAIKVNGQKLYNLARKNIEIDVKEREIEIYDIYDIKIYDDILEFKCLVSSGTYIRSLVRDIAYMNNNFATMIYLKRTKIGDFNLCDNVEFLDVFNAFNYPNVNIDKIEYERLKNGLKIKKELINSKYHCFVDGEYKGIILSKNNNVIKTKYFL